MYRLVGIAAAAVLLLSGCAATAAEPPSTSPASAEAADPAPGARVPVDCDTLLTATELSAAAGAALAPTADPASRNLQVTALLQAGVLSCSWATAAGENWLNLLIVPADGVGGSFEPVVAEPAVLDTVVPGSSRGCLAYEARADCSLAFSAAEYVVEIFVSGVNEQGAAELAIDAAGVRIAGVLAENAPLPAWVAPATGTLAAWECSAADPTGAIAAAFPDATFEAPVWYGSGQGPSILFETVGLTGYSECMYVSDGPMVSVVVLPGGAWAWESTVLPTDTAETVPGADRAVSRCDAYSCDVFATTATSLVQVNVSTEGRADALADATAALAAYLPVLPVVEP